MDRFVAGTEFHHVTGLEAPPLYAGVQLQYDDCHDLCLKAIPQLHIYRCHRHVASNSLLVHNVQAQSEKDAGIQLLRYSFI